MALKNVKTLNKGIIFKAYNWLGEAFNSWCEKTNLHGFHYLSLRNSIFTRLFFACVNFSSFLLCLFLIMMQLHEYHEQSVITTVKTTAYPVWKVYFPSITICNFNVVYKANVKKILDVVEASCKANFINENLYRHLILMLKDSSIYTDVSIFYAYLLPKLKQLTFLRRANKINEQIFNDMLYNLSALIIYDELDDISGYKKVFEQLEDAGYNVDTLMHELAHPCDKMIQKCFWQSDLVKCSEIFESVKTSQGYCCGFNYYGTEDTVDNLEDPRRKPFRHVGGAGPNLGLRLLFDIEQSQYIASIKPTYGINILIQDGYDYPDMELIANTLLPSEELTISVTPQVYISSDRVKLLDYDNRKCLFENEGGLEWTATYSYKTCINQCKMEAILHYCKCVPFYYPVRDKYNALEILDGSFSPNDLVKMQENNSTVQCKCYPQCNIQMFNVHTDRSMATQMIGFEYSNLSMVNIYYNTIGCIHTERDVHFTWDRVVATIGGIFGLCLGGSIISILECLYFFGKTAMSCKKRSGFKQKTKPYKPQIYVTDFKCYSHNKSKDKWGKIYDAKKTTNGRKN